MRLFKGQNLLEFTERFKIDKDCKKYLSELKWNDGYNCRSCNHDRYQLRSDLSRTCNKCSDTESPTAGTLFHRVRFGLRKAFFICFEMATTTKGLSACQMGVRYGVTEKTARLFMHKEREAMKSSENYPMDGDVQVDEFVIGGKETGKVGRSYDSNKKKVVCALELTENGKVKRLYSIPIENYSSKELNRIFAKHIAKEANVKTDKWRGYNPLKENYKITQIESNGGREFPILHVMIHKIKSWIRTTFANVSDFNCQRYLNEFSYRLNRSQTKDFIFNNLVKRMVNSDKIYQKKLVCS